VLLASSYHALGCDTRVQWVAAGRMLGMNSILERYPDTHFEVGVVYNSIDILVRKLHGRVLRKMAD